MFAKTITAALLGIEGHVIEVEADVQNGLPAFILTGALSNETKEAQYRVWNALKYCGVKLEPRKITVNFSPAFIRKEGTAYDLPIAVAVLGGYGLLDTGSLTDTAFFGETGLDGSLKPVRGALPLAFSLRENGIRRLIVPAENAEEASLAVPAQAKPGHRMEVIGCGSLSEVMDYLKFNKLPEHSRAETGAAKRTGETAAESDFSDIHGQEFLKRAVEIAVSGMHNILLSGPAGTGKTMIAKRIPTIMPELTRDEDIEISKIYSICGLLPEGKHLLSRRPFRSPHHGISDAAFAGGGSRVMPGEISLASGGVLFLDEMPLFSRNVLETLRQPMEDRTITVTRVHGNYTYPADFMLAAAMNNCACGYFPDKKKCTCTRAQVKTYMGRLSKPLMERIDICAEAKPVGYDELVKNKCGGESSAAIRDRVVHAHEIQKARFESHGCAIRYNSHMGVREIERYCVLGKAETGFMQEIFKSKNLSGRTYHKVLKVARTIADMGGSTEIGVKHLEEAVALRSIEDKLFTKIKA